MRFHRFYVDQEIGKEVLIDEKDLLHQWQKVFRFKAGDKIIIFNGSSFDYDGHFKILTKKEAIIVVDNKRQVKNPVNIELHIFQSIIKKDNFEFIVEKCTELGVSAFHPLISERSDQAHSGWIRQEKNIMRLNKIATEAAEQSGKTELPKIFNPEKLEKAISDFDGQLFILDFDGDRLAKIDFTQYGKVGILIGPEGGWTDNERIWFEEKEIESICLGEQILRAETAAIAASSLILLG